MSYIKIYIHMVFATKQRIPFLKTRGMRFKVFEHIRENARKKDIWLDSVNGYTDHLHCLLSLGSEQTISDIARYLKGESSCWINKNKLTVKKFRWQGQFWAAGVSESHIPRVRRYIQNQEKKHGVTTFSEEIEFFEKVYKMKIFRD